MTACPASCTHVPCRALGPVKCRDPRWCRPHTALSREGTRPSEGTSPVPVRCYAALRLSHSSRSFWMRRSPESQATSTSISSGRSRVQRTWGDTSCSAPSLLAFMRMTISPEASVVADHSNDPSQRLPEEGWDHGETAASRALRAGPRPEAP